ncbi:MAG: 2-iminoacetate synthase ThiH [Deltaproteobacteria bacterium]
MFSVPSFQILRHEIQTAPAEAVEQALTSPRPGLDGLAALLSPAAEPYLPAMARRSAEITVQRFGRTVQLYAPLYLSNWCTNRCAYCGFSTDNTIGRRVLTLEEAAKEAAILAERGFSHLLLVSGEAPAKLGVDYLEEIARRLRNRFAALSIEVQPLTTEQYRRLFEAGITAVAVYQETYDRETYDEVHLAGKKKNFEFRLETPARAAEAGMREIGIGSLLGLADWRCEALALGMHLAWLRKNYWRTSLTVSFPRLRPAEGGFKPRQQVGERQLSQMIFALRIFDPDVGLLLSTREEARYRDGMIGLGPTRYSAGSCTAPGGYSEPASDGEQFAVGDHRSIDEVSLAICRKGFDPVRKDWDAAFQANETAA